ncbi:MAG: hypothetical protein INQ03_16355 [Candidatus Heimdallarchaeota archaeon]|nr:hypothetical protein [Candidatus Heimdallarchaeota archaeon]
MFSDTTKNKTSFLNIRIQSSDLEKFNQFCNERQLSRGETARKAIAQHVIMNFNDDVNPKLIFSKSQFKIIFDSLSDEILLKLINQSIENGSRDMKALDSYFDKNEILASENMKEINFMISTLSQFTFSSTGQSWFETFEYHWNNQILNIHGTHLLGSTFSSYIEQLLTRYFGMHEYSIKSSEQITRMEHNSTIYLLSLQFEPKEGEKS